jgi:hypothetical protein
MVLLLFSPLGGSTYHVTQAALAGTFITAWHRFFLTRNIFCGEFLSGVKALMIQEKSAQRPQINILPRTGAAISAFWN